MNYATISADIISYTSLAETEKRKLENNVKQLLDELSQKYSDQSFYGRIIQGDYIEAVIKSPEYSLRIALLLKTFIKSIDIKTSNESKSGLKYFFEHGVRLAVAVAPLTTFDPAGGIIDGEAIYLSGRTIKNHSTSNKKKIVIKSSMFFRSPGKELQEQFNALFYLLDIIISKCSAKQSEVVFYKLLGSSEKEISEKLGKSQSTISQHSNAAGWLAIEKAINYFENTVK